MDNTSSVNVLSPAILSSSTLMVISVTNDRVPSWKVQIALRIYAERVLRV